MIYCKEDDRPKKGWWAPGEYNNTCRKCGDAFIGDKRAGHCADCEYGESASSAGSDLREAIIRDIKNVACIYPTAFDLYDEPLERLVGKLMRTFKNQND